jgi:hypothetical protein
MRDEVEGGGDGFTSSWASRLESRGAGRRYVSLQFIRSSGNATINCGCICSGICSGIDREILLSWSHDTQFVRSSDLHNILLIFYYPAMLSGCQGDKMWSRVTACWKNLDDSVILIVIIITITSTTTTVIMTMEANKVHEGHNLKQKTKSKIHTHNTTQVQS